MAASQMQYEQSFEDARQAIVSGNTENGIALCKAALLDNELPRYYRIKTLALLASITTDWRQKEEMRLHAEHIWIESRTLWPEGQNETTDMVLQDLRSLLDGLKIEQAKTMPDDYEDMLSAALVETEIEDLADIADGETEACADEEYERSKRARSENPPDQDEMSVVDDAERFEPVLFKSASNPSFAPASTLRDSQHVLGHTRNGQTAGSSMMRRRGGISRRST